jgi:molybdate transport system substrate-binding protein
LALADPQYVPAGKYAKTALERLGAWPSVANRIAAAENVRAALALVARGEAPVGIVYQTDAASEPKVRIAAMIDENLHAPIVYPVALLLRSASAGAEAYLAFLSSPRARAIFEKHGFTPR